MPDDKEETPHRRRHEGVCLPEDILRHARALRRDSSDAESKLWHFLRDRRLGGFKFRRQHPVGRFILDFYCAEAQLAVELDGGQHAEPYQAAYDEERTRVLNEWGICVLRFWDNDALKNTLGVLEMIWEALHEQRGGSCGGEGE